MLFLLPVAALISVVHASRVYALSNEASFFVAALQRHPSAQEQLELFAGLTSTIEAAIRDIQLGEPCCATEVTTCAEDIRAAVHGVIAPQQLFDMLDTSLEMLKRQCAPYAVDLRHELVHLQQAVLS